MSYSVNGQTFQVQTAFDHATSMLNYMNSLLQAQALPTLQPNNGNALWWTLLAQGSFDAQMDLIIQQAANSFNVALCDDNQILNLLPIAGTSLIPAGYSSVLLNFTASSGILNVPSGTQIPYASYIFTTLSGISVPTSGVGQVYAQCNTSGPITVPVGNIYQISIAGLNYLANVTNAYAAIPGNTQETVAQARTRILNGKAIGVGIDGAITALRQLPGVGQANIFMNVNASGYLPVSGLANGLPARTAWILVQGYNPNIASTYLSYMNMPTSGALFTPGNTQIYTTQAGQNFPVSFDYAKQQQIYATVYYDINKATQNGFTSLIQNALIGLNNQFTIGQRVSSEYCGTALNPFSAASILGVTLSLTPSGTYGQAVQGSQNSIPFFNASGIQVVGI